MRVAVFAVLFLVMATTSALAVRPCTRADGTQLRDAYWQDGPRRHPLIGQVLKGDRPIPVAQDGCARSPFQQLVADVWEVMRGGGIVLLGEVHDNAEHHAARGDVLHPSFESLAATSSVKPAAVFEHIRTSQQPGLDRFHRSTLGNPAGRGAMGLLHEIDWASSGWPAAEIFAPLFQAALAAGQTIYPGNAVRERMRALVRGKAPPEEHEIPRLKLAQDLPLPLLDALTEELAGSHCGMLPASALGSMGLAQRYTDAHLAEAVVQAAGRHDGAFLLAGNGHVRTDRAVPWYVRRMAPQQKVVAVMFLEVADGKADPAVYLPRAPDGAVAADYVVFTPRQDRADPCEKMRSGRP